MMTKEVHKTHHRHTNNKGERFARHGFALRLVADIGGFFIFFVWSQEKTISHWIWAHVFIVGFVWPFLAYGRTRIAHSRYKAERLNIFIDGILCGVMAAIFEFSLVPALSFFLLNAMVMLNVMGPKGLMLSSILYSLGVLLFTTFNGFTIDTSISQEVAAASMLLVIFFCLYQSHIIYTLSIVRKKEQKTLEKLSRTDGLSGLYNRTYWESAVKRQFEYCQKNHEESVLLLIDIDHFKGINDKQGHVVGDSVIQQLGKMVSESIRPSDIAGRYGGDEFGIVLRKTDNSTAQSIAERLIHYIDEESSNSSSHIHFTVSIGMQAFSSTFGNHSKWIVETDYALYQAKAAGRNRLYQASTPLSHTSLES